jgi:hypothetical protein
MPGDRWLRCKTMKNISKVSWRRRLQKTACEWTIGSALSLALAVHAFVLRAHSVQGSCFFLSASTHTQHQQNIAGRRDDDDDETMTRAGSFPSISPTARQESLGWGTLAPSASESSQLYECESGGPSAVTRNSVDGEHCGAP